MSIPKGKPQSGQASSFQQARFAGSPFVRGNPVDTSRGGEVPFGGAPGYAAAVVAAAHSHPSQHSAHSQHAAHSQPPPPPPTHGQAGSVSAVQAGSMRASLHHPGAGGPPQGGPPPQQQSQQQQAPPPTSTPPGAPPQQHGDMSKQGPPPHMQGQQPPLPGSAHSQMHYLQQHSARQPQFVPRQTMNARMPNHRAMPSNNLTPQMGSFQVSHQVYQQPNLMASNMSTQPMFAHQLVQFPQNRGGNHTQPMYQPNQPYIYSFVPPAAAYQPQPPANQYYLAGNQMTMVRQATYMGQQQPQQQPNTTHVANPAVSAPQPGSSGMPVTGSGQQGPPARETQQRRRTHAIAIVDPETGKDLLEEICSERGSSAAATPPRSGESSARQTPQPTANPDIAAEFAAKVAIAAGEGHRHPPISTPPMNLSMRRPGSESAGPAMPAGQVNGPSVVSGEYDANPSISQPKTPVVSQGKESLAEPNSKTNVGEAWKNKSSSSPTQQTPQPSQVEPSDAAAAAVLGYPVGTELSTAVAAPSSSDSSITAKSAAEKVVSASPVSIVDSSCSKEPDKPEDSLRQSVPIASGPQSGSSSGKVPVPEAVVPTTAVDVPASSPQESATLKTVPSVRQAPLLQQPSGQPVPLPQRPKREETVPQHAATASTVDQANGDLEPADGKGQWRSAKGRNKQQPPPPQRGEMTRRGAEKEAAAPAPDMEASKSAEEESAGASSSSTSAASTPSLEAKTPPSVSPLAPTPLDKESAETTAPEAPTAPSASSILEKALSNSQVASKEEEVSAAEEKLVAARNEENTRASAEPPNTPSPTTVIEKPMDLSAKLVYNKDQWSPQNLEGKKKYERDFLIQLKNDPQSLKRPEDLPKLEVVINDSYKSRSNDSRPLGTLNRGGPNTDSLLLPKFMSAAQNTPRGSLLKGRNSQQGKSKTPKVIQLNLSLNEDVKLNETENAWRPARMVPKGAEESVVVDSETEVGRLPGPPGTEELYKKVRSVLNKLTPQKFDLLVDQVKALPIDTKEKLEGVINLVFEKAVDEPNFSVAYAMMCHTLSGMQVPVSKSKDPSKEGKAVPEYVQFKKLLLMRCQAEFEKQRDTSNEEITRKERLKETEATESEKRKDLEMALEEGRRIRMKYVGVNRFIGELYKRQMLTANIMVQCISKLLEENDEESLECLCKLLTTIGKELETRIDKDKKPTDLGQHFQRMQNIVDGRKTSSRIRFMLQDVIELRADKWRPRRGDSNPKTMDEIAKEAAQESLTQLTAPPAHSMRGSKDDRDRDRDRDRKRGRGGVSDDGWTTAGGGGRISMSRGPVEISKLKVKHENMDMVNLGSKSQFTNWSKGSGGHKSKTDLAGAPGINPFSVLEMSEKPASLGPMKDSLTNASRSSDREAALAEARKFTVGGNEAPVITRLSRPSSRDSSVKREETPTPKAQTPTNMAKVLSEADLENKCKLLLNEYLSDENAQELVRCVQEEVNTSQLAGMVSHWLQLAFEWSALKRTRTSNGLISLHKAGVLNHADLLPALEEILSMAEDLLIDIPMTYRYLAELTVPLLRCEALQFSHLRDSLKPFKATGGATKLLLESMKLLQKEEGPGWIVPRWKASDMSWSEFVPEDRVEAFLTENGLDYFLDSSSKESEKLPSGLPQLPQEVMPVQEMHDRLVGLMKESSYDNVVQWIAVNIGKDIQKPKYIRALMTAICQVGTNQEKAQWKLNVVVFNQYSKLIRRFVDNDYALELQALYAVQAFVTQLMHPSALLATILSNLLEEGVLARDSIQAWVKSDDPAEAEGRGVALKSINQFVAWLDEPEYDSLDEAS